MEQYINKIINADCLDILKQLPDKCVDLVLTDPPYGGVNRETNGLRNLDKGCADIVDFDFNAWLKEIMRVCKGSFYIWCGHEQVSDIFKAFNQNKISSRLIIWEKTNPSPMNGDCIWLSGIEPCVYGKRGGGNLQRLLPKYSNSLQHRKRNNTRNTKTNKPILKTYYNQFKRKRPCFRLFFWFWHYCCCLPQTQTQIYLY